MGEQHGSVEGSREWRTSGDTGQRPLNIPVSAELYEQDKKSHPTTFSVMAKFQIPPAPMPPGQLKVAPACLLRTNLVFEPVAYTRGVAADVADVLLGQHVAPDANALPMLPAQTLLALQGVWQ